MTTATACVDCGRPSERARCSPCLREYRRSVDYRGETLHRDGAHCALCPQWRNRLVLAVFGAPAPCPTPCPDCGREHRGMFGLIRRLEVDHITPLGAGGAQSAENWQVACRPHHRAKTRLVDMPMLRGLPARLSRSRALVRVVGWGSVLAALYGAYSADAWLLPAVLAALLLPAVVVHRRCAAIRGRLWEALAPVLGASNTQRRPIRRCRWTLRRGRLRLRAFQLHYPHTLDDSDPDLQARIERRVQAKLGGTWCAQWTTVRDQVALRSPDPLADPTPIPWAAPEPGRSLWDPIPVGIGEGGEVVAIRLVGKNLLIGGEPGGGKSVSLSELVAPAVLDPDVTVHLVDGKRVEFAKYARCAASVVGTQAQFRELLDELIATMEMRYDMLLAEGREQVERGDGYGLHVLFIDELAFFVTGGKKADRDVVLDLLRDLIQRGRAAGIIVVAATQRPSADVIPTMIRDLFGYRWALRCSTPSSSDMVLGAGWASQGYSAAKIDAAMRGVGLLLHEGGRPIRLRTFLPERDQLLAAVAAGAELRDRSAA